MLSKLFKPKWQSPKADVRLRSVQQLNDQRSEQCEILIRLACEDESQEVRNAAIAKLHSIDALKKVANKHDESDVKKRVLRRLSEVLVKQSGNAPQKLLVDRPIEDPILVEALFVDATDLDKQQAKVAAFGLNDLALVSAVAALNSGTLRHNLATLINDEDALERLEKTVKNKDKRVYRIARDKLKEKRAERLAEHNIQEEIARVLQQLEQLMRIDYDNIYEAKLQQLDKQWQRLMTRVSDSQRQRFERALSVCQATVSAAQSQHEEQQSQLEAQRNAMMECLSACEQIEACLPPAEGELDIATIDIPGLNAVLKTQQVRWLEAVDSYKGHLGPERLRFEKAEKGLQQLIDATASLRANETNVQALSDAILSAEEKNLDIKKIAQWQKKADKLSRELSWPNKIAKPGAITGLEQALQHLEQLQDQLSQQQKRAVDTIDQSIAKLKTAISEGGLKQANRLMRDCFNMAKLLPSKDASRYQSQLRELNAQVSELKDWQGYATTPKKEELCVRMEQLIEESEMDPVTKAEEVKRLQMEWRDLNQGDPSPSKDLWERFKKAGDKAYEPCKAYYDDLAGTRQQNLESRIKVCDQLRQYLDTVSWSNVDWKVVEEIYHTAKQEWKTYSPVNRQEGKTVQQRFNELLAEFEDRLEDFWKRNCGRKQALVERAQALLEIEDTQQAIEQAKQLQREWRSVGATRRNDHRRLWKQFKAACDGVFKQQQERKEAAAKAEQEQVSEAKRLCASIEALLEADSETLLGSQSQVRQWAAEFEGLTLPKHQLDKLDRRLRTALNDVRHRVRDVEVAQRREIKKRLWSMAAMCEQAERAWQCAEEDKANGLIEQLKEDAPSKDIVPEEWIPLLERVERISSVVGDRRLLSVNADNVLSEKRELCIRMEILAGVNSPEGDQEQRMAMQVARLSGGLSQREQESLSPDEQRDQLQQLWARQPGLNMDEDRDFSRRFEQALKAFGEE